MTRINVTLYGRLYRSMLSPGKDSLVLVSKPEDETLWPLRTEDVVGLVALLKEFLPKCKSCVVCGSPWGSLHSGFHYRPQAVGERWMRYDEHVCEPCWKWQMVLSNKAILSR